MAPKLENVQTQRKWVEKRKVCRTEQSQTWEDLIFLVSIERLIWEDNGEDNIRTNPKGIRQIWAPRAKLFSTQKLTKG